MATMCLFDDMQFMSMVISDEGVHLSSDAFNVQATDQHRLASCQVDLENAHAVRRDDDSVILLIKVFCNISHDITSYCIVS